MSAGAIGEQTQLLLLDAVLHLATGTGGSTYLRPVTVRPNGAIPFFTYFELITDTFTSVVLTHPDNVKQIKPEECPLF